MAKNRAISFLEGRKGRARKTASDSLRRQRRRAACPTSLEEKPLYRTRGGKKKRKKKKKSRPRFVSRQKKKGELEKYCTPPTPAGRRGEERKKGAEIENSRRGKRGEGEWSGREVVISTLNSQIRRRKEAILGERGERDERKGKREHVVNSSWGGDKKKILILFLRFRMGGGRGNQLGWKEGGGGVR